MKALVGWLAVAAVLYCAYFIAARVLKLLFGRRRSEAVLHDELADVADDVAGASRVAAALSAALAWFLAPAGLLALGAAVGLVPTPLIAKLVASRGRDQLQLLGPDAQLTTGGMLVGSVQAIDTGPNVG